MYSGQPTWPGQENSWLECAMNLSPSGQLQSRNLTKHKLNLITPDSTELKQKKTWKRYDERHPIVWKKTRFFRWEIKFDGPFHWKFSEKTNVRITLFSFSSESLEYHCTIWWWNTPFLVLHLGKITTGFSIQMKAGPLCQIIYNRYIPFLSVGKLNCDIGGKILTGFSGPQCGKVCLWLVNLDYRNIIFQTCFWVSFCFFQIGQKWNYYFKKYSFLISSLLFVSDQAMS